MRTRLSRQLDPTRKGSRYPLTNRQLWCLLGIRKRTHDTQRGQRLSCRSTGRCVVRGQGRACQRSSTGLATVRPGLL